VGVWLKIKELTNAMNAEVLLSTAGFLQLKIITNLKYFVQFLCCIWREEAANSLSSDTRLNGWRHVTFFVSALYRTDTQLMPELHCCCTHTSYGILQNVISFKRNVEAGFKHYQGNLINFQILQTLSVLTQHNFTITRQ
jgi:hypothetical protein